MSYSMMLSALSPQYKTVEDLKKLKENYTEAIKKAENTIKESNLKEIEAKKKDNETCIKEIDNELEEREFNELKENLIVTDDHKKLLAEMEFVYFKEGGDYVFIGVDGKRPWGNSDYYNDIARILKWELPNDDLSNRQREKAEQLIKELPIALNKILQSVCNLRNI